MPGTRYINAVMSVRRIAPNYATLKDGRACVKATSTKAAFAAGTAHHAFIAAIVDDSETSGNPRAIAAGYTTAANEALHAADALCRAANNLTALANMYQEKS